MICRYRKANVLGDQVGYCTVSQGRAQATDPERQCSSDCHQDCLPLVVQSHEERDLIDLEQTIQDYRTTEQHTVRPASDKQYELTCLVVSVVAEV